MEGSFLGSPADKVLFKVAVDTLYVSILSDLFLSWVIILFLGMSLFFNQKNVPPFFFSFFFFSLKSRCSTLYRILKKTFTPSN